MPIANNTVNGKRFNFPIHNTLKIYMFDKYSYFLFIIADESPKSEYVRF